MTTREHGGMACMAQKYYGHRDVNERKVCYAGREMEYLKVMQVKRRMMSC